MLKSNILYIQQKGRYKLDIKFTTKPYMPTLIISALLLFTAIFLPWATAAGFATANGTADWGTMSTIAAIIGIVLAYLTAVKIRALGLMVVGVLALVGAIVYATRLGGATLGFGLIIEMLLALGAIYIGFQDYTKSAS
jgi:hypothetical protein